jgi:thiamine biosynthesis protein ThiC
MSKKEILEKSVRFIAKNDSFIEFGTITNNIFGNEIYVMTNTNHEIDPQMIYKMRQDEALMFIEGLSHVLNKLREEVEKN